MRPNPTRPSARRPLALAALFAATMVAADARAALIFDRATTKVVAGGDDVNPVNVTLPTAFPLYGTLYTDIRVGSNGGFGVPNGLNGTQYESSQNPWHKPAQQLPIIAALWDDANTQPNNAGGIDGTYGGLSRIGTTTYNNSYSFTVPATRFYGNPASVNTVLGFQVSLFTGAETVTLAGGEQFSFLPGDIALSYNLVDAAPGLTGGNAAVGITNGLAAGSGGLFTGFDNGSNGGSGVITSTAQLPTGLSFILLRPTAGSYTSSVQTFSVIPEPATLGLVGVGVLGLLRRRSA
jgi:hypothetical protein